METSELFSPHYGRIFTSFVPLACNHHFAEGALQYYYILYLILVALSRVLTKVCLKQSCYNHNSSNILHTGLGWPLQHWWWGWKIQRRSEGINTNITNAFHYGSAAEQSCNGVLCVVQLSAGWVLHFIIMTSILWPKLGPDLVLMMKRRRELN